MLKITLITLAVLAILATAGFAWARHNGYCDAEGYSGRIVGRVSRKLDLDEDQIERLEGFAEALRGMRDDWVKRRTQVGDEVRDLLATPTLDQARVMALLDDRRQAMAARKQELVEAFADFSDGLQPEQRTRLAELISDRMQHRWGRRYWNH